MESDRRNSLVIAAQPELNIDSKTSKTNDDSVKHHAKEKTDNSPESNDTMPQATDEETTTPQYASPRELALLSTVFTIATFMIAIDGSILGRYYQALSQSENIIAYKLSDGHPKDHQ